MLLLFMLCAKPTSIRDSFIFFYFLFFSFRFFSFLFILLYHQDVAEFREFLLIKLINGEKATFQTPTFSLKRERTLEMLIKDMYEEYAHDTKMVSLNLFS